MKKDIIETTPRRSGILEYQEVLLSFPYNANLKIFNKNDYHILEGKLDGLKVYTFYPKKIEKEIPEGRQEKIDEVFK